MRNEWKIVICLFVGVVLLRPVEMQCNPSFLLPNIIKDIVYLQYSSPEEQFYPYIFFSAMISGEPIVAYAINQQSIEQTNTTLKFYLDIEMQQTQIDFYYNAPNFKWTITSVNFWISSRNDLIISKTVLQNIGQGQNQSRVFSITSNAQIDSQSTHIVFIVGIYSTYTQNLTVSVIPGAVTANNASVSVVCGSSVYLTNISLISIIYNPTAAQFLSSSGSLNYKNFKGQYYNLYTNFMPIYYSLIGFSSFSLTGSNLASFRFNLEIVNSSLLNSSAKGQFDSLTLNYMTVGISMSKICDPCNNYFTEGACSDTCPANTYSATYQDGGKACLGCNPLVGQMLNDLQNGCSCIPGYELISTNQCSSSGTGGSVTCTGVNQFLNGSVCACSPGTFNISGACGTCPTGQAFQNGVCNAPTCPPNASYNPSSKVCLCDFGFMNISNVCKSCEQGQTFDPSTLFCKCIGLNQALNSLGKCQCAVGFYNISGTCKTCPDGTTFNGQSCISSKITCSQNQVISNNLCICDAFSVPLGSTCIKCSSGTYASKTSNKCEACMPNCNSCQNNISCAQCVSGFIFNNALRSCQNPNIAKKIAMKSGFPVYLQDGIISDFLLNSTKLNKKSTSELKGLVNAQFSDLSALPGRIFISQNPNDTNTIRIGFYYQGLFPLQPFSVIYSFQEMSADINQQQTINYQYTSQNLKGNIPK